MPKLFWIGSPFFHDALSACGWEITAHNFEQPAVFGWSDIVALAGGEPDAVIVADKSRPPFVLGQEDFPCPTVLYAVDTHIHSWLPAYAQSFDLCLVSLRDHLPHFLDKRLTAAQVAWFPPYAPTAAQPPSEPVPHVWPCLFVGRVDPSLTPGRVEFLRRLRELAPGLNVMQGPYAALYPQADVVLNVSEHGDLNFRVFEALGCGSCLVTPRVGHGLEELFRDGRDLILYPELDVAAAARAVEELLADPGRRARLAQSGLAAVNRAHRDIHRARALSRLLRALPASRVAARRAQARMLRRAWLRPLYLLLAESLDNAALRTAYLRAATAGKNSHASIHQGDCDA